MRTASLKTPTRKKRKSSASWPEMLVDIILSLLSREHQVWSGVVEKCFQFIVPHLTSESFHLIIKVTKYMYTCIGGLCAYQLQLSIALGIYMYILIASFFMKSHSLTLLILCRH